MVMVKVSNKIIALINLFTFLLSLWILRQGIWLSQRGTTDCERLLEWPVIGLGAFVMLLSVAGFVGAFFRVTSALSLYLVVVFSLVLLMVTGFTIFFLAVTAEGSGRSVEGREYKEYSLGDYSMWLQRMVEKTENWKKIKSCIQDAEICKSLEDDKVNVVAEKFYRTHLSPIQSGCCKPPTSCGFRFVNPILWDKNSGPKNSTDSDCKIWDNNYDKLCYDCKSCKTGLVANLNNDWRKVAIWGITVVTVLMVIYFTACCACINNKKDNEYEYGVYRMAKLGYP